MILAGLSLIVNIVFIGFAMIFSPVIYHMRLYIYYINAIIKTKFSQSFRFFFHKDGQPDYLNLRDVKLTWLLLLSNKMIMSRNWFLGIIVTHNHVVYCGSALHTQTPMEK